MRYPPIHVDNMNVKLTFHHIELSLLYGRFGYFYDSMVEHSHSKRSYELHYIPQGKGILVANNKKYFITPGTLFMTGPDVTHEQLTVPSNPMAEYCLCFEVTPASNRNNNERLATDDAAIMAERLVNTPFWFGQDSQNMMQSFEQLAYETTNQYIGYYNNVRNILEQIIIKLIRNYTRNDSSSTDLPNKTLDDKRLVIIENEFLFNYGDVSIQNLSDKLGLSVRQTERTIKQNYGVSFREKKLQARMSAAAHLLTTTTKTISDVASEVGFSTLEYFCNAFKKYYNVSANAYRKRHRHQDVDSSST